MASIASRTKRRKSVATWSFRDRAVWSRPASGPISCGEPRLDMGVDVLEFRREGELARLDLSQDRV